MFNLFKKKPALKPSPRLRSATLSVTGLPSAVTHAAPDPQTALIVRNDGDFVRVQVTHEEYDTDLTLAAYAKDSVHHIIFNYDYEGVQE